MEWIKRMAGIVRGDTVPEIEEGALETAAERRERWRSLYVVYFTMFLMSLGFTIVLTGVWPYLDKLEAGADKSFVGFVVGAHPLGQLACAPLLGLWSNKRGVRGPLLATLALYTLAGIWYAQLYLTRPYAKYCMVAARFFVGVSSANVAVMRSYVSAATLSTERTGAVASVSLAQVLGFIVGPALQAAVTPLGPGVPPDQASILSLDMYTAAAWINAVMGALNFILFLPFCFKERKIAAREAMRDQRLETEKEALKAVKPDYVSSWVLVGAFFALLFNFVLLETLATSLTMDQFAWSKKQALEYLGALMSVGAVVACATFIAIKPLTRMFEERALLIWGGFLLTAMGSVMCIPWGPGPPPPAPDPVTAAPGQILGDGIGEAVGGCPAITQPWCPNSRGLHLSQFLIGYALVAVGYSLGVTLIQTIFSKVLGPRPQGVWMGVLTGAGCLSRVLGPLWVSLVYARRGPTIVFTSTALLTGAAAIALRLVYRRLQPPALPAAPAELSPLNAAPANTSHDKPPTVAELAS